VTELAASAPVEAHTQIAGVYARSLPMSSTISIANSPASARFSGLESMIGNTPLLAIDYEIGGRRRTVYAKSEQMNFTGSIKDRMALHILRLAYAQGSIHSGDTIVEATSGNTGISFAALGRALGHAVTIFMPNWMSRERVDLIHSLGANIVPVTKAQVAFSAAFAWPRKWPRSAMTFFCRGNSPIPPTLKPTSRPPVRNCIGSYGRKA